MIKVRSALATALVGFAVLSSAPAVADPASVRTVIERQLEAFRAGDAAAAFAFAAPEIKAMFGTPGIFVAMVERSYKPVYDANEPVFLRTRQIGEGRYAQEVGLVDDAGKPWTALYTLEQQDDGRWAITGCYLREADGAVL